MTARPLWPLYAALATGLYRMARESALRTAAHHAGAVGDVLVEAGAIADSRRVVFAGLVAHMLAIHCERKADEQ